MTPGRTSFPDISDWYTPQRVEQEEGIWARGKHYLENAKRIEEVCKAHGLRTVAEFGCGTGWIPTVLDPSLKYLVGIDRNSHMLALARGKSPAKFVQCDLRNLVDLVLDVDLVCSFAVLKHFSLEDWPGILKDILRHGRYGLFNQHCLPDSEVPYDAGEEWHSCWPCNRDIVEAVERAGHQIIARDDSHLDTGTGFPETYFVTQRRRAA